MIAFAQWRNEVTLCALDCRLRCSLFQNNSPAFVPSHSVHVAEWADQQAWHHNPESKFSTE